MRRLLALAIAAFASGTASAAEPGACTRVDDRTLAAEFRAWSAGRAELTAGSTADAAPRIEPGRAATVALHPSARVRLDPAPARIRPVAAAHAGVLRLLVPQAGTYRVALSTAAWIDVVEAGRALASVAHDGAPRCSSVRKIVDFELRPGPYLVQLSSNPGPNATLLVARKP